MLHELIPLVAIMSVFGMPTALIALHLRQRHRERMRALETNAHIRRVAELEGARSDLESRMRTLETIVTEGDRDLDERLRRLSAAAAPPLASQPQRPMIERPRQP